MDNEDDGPWPQTERPQSAEPTDGAQAAMDLVQSLTGMRQEPKVAWKYIWKLARYRPDTIWVSFCELGHDQGVGERSGRRHIKTLKDRGLIEQIEELPGRARVYVWDPREVCHGRDRSVNAERPLLDHLDGVNAGGTSAGHARTEPAPPSVTPSIGTAEPGHDLAQHVSASDGPADVAQGLTTPAEAVQHLAHERQKIPEHSANVAQQAPRPSLARVRAPSDPSEVLNLNNLKPSVPSEPSDPSVTAQSSKSAEAGSAEVAQQPPGRSLVPDPELAALLRIETQNRSAAKADADRTTERPVTRAVQPAVERLIARIPGDRDRTRVVEAIVARIKKRVNDPLLREAPAVRVARAIVYGQDCGFLPEEELDASFISLDKDRASIKCRFGYWVVTMQNAFARHGLSWPRKGDPK